MMRITFVEMLLCILFVAWIGANSFILTNNSLVDIIRLPTYCVQPEVLAIFSRRFTCMAMNSTSRELNKLQYQSTSEYLRSHELIAHEFFLNTRNPYRRNNCDDAEFEYIPLLPLNWIATTPDAPRHCTYAALIEDIVSYVKWLKEKEELSAILSSKRPRFSVASTFNLRTAMGTGMPSPHRRGEVYDMVTLFVTTTSIGHYERWPQCPDLLRKSWKYVMEIPYLPLHHHHTILQSLDVTDAQSVRIHKLSFSGRLLLFGPERVCSVRNAITSLASMPGVVVVDVPVEESMQSPNTKVFKLMQTSTFCLIAKADSYSTASFYSAVHAGCIPVVISDWFVFAFPWSIPYEEFVIRILEEDFLKNPHQVISHMFTTYFTSGKYKQYQEAMMKWLPLLSFEFVSLGNSRYRRYRELIFHEVPGTSQMEAVLPSIPVSSERYSALTEYSILPFELMLLELRYAQKPELVHKTVPCAGPFKCTWNGNTLIDNAINFKQPRNKLVEDRSHLCKHASRLIGHYKIVYFMQCVRILWPLTPGKLTKSDLPATSTFSKSSIVNGDEGIRDVALKKSQLDSEDLAFIMNFHSLTNLSKSGGWRWTTYPKFEQESLVKRLHDLS